MIDDKDIQKLKKVFATKDDLKKSEEKILDKMFENFVTKNEFHEFRGEMREMREELYGMLRKILSAGDNDVKKLDVLESEHAALGFQVERHERWFGVVSKKIGVALKQD